VQCGKGESELLVHGHMGVVERKKNGRVQGIGMFGDEVRIWVRKTFKVYISSIGVRRRMSKGVEDGCTLKRP
jgi:hypothetical protein